MEHWSLCPMLKEFQAIHFATSVDDVSFPFHLFWMGFCIAELCRITAFLYYNFTYP